LLAAAVGVAGVFWLIGGLGVVALALVVFVLPAERSVSERAKRGDWREALTRTLLPHYAGIFMLHLTLTAAFIAVPQVLRDVHGVDASRHWLVSQRLRWPQSRMPLCSSRAAAEAAAPRWPVPGHRGLAAMAFAGRFRHVARRPRARRCLQFPEARLPAT
jgi:hypothetical protein